MTFLASGTVTSARPTRAATTAERPGLTILREGRRSEEVNAASASSIRCGHRDIKRPASASSATQTHSKRGQCVTSRISSNRHRIRCGRPTSNTSGAKETATPRATASASRARHRSFAFHLNLNLALPRSIRPEMEKLFWIICHIAKCHLAKFKFWCHSRRSRSSRSLPCTPNARQMLARHQFRIVNISATGLTFF